MINSVEQDEKKELMFVNSGCEILWVQKLESKTYTVLENALWGGGGGVLEGGQKQLWGNIGSFMAKICRD